MSKENKNKNQTYSGNSIASYWLSGTWLGNLLGYGNNTYTDGYGVERQNPSLQESAQGQQLSRMKDTAKNYGKLALVGASFDEFLKPLMDRREDLISSGDFSSLEKMYKNVFNLFSGRIF